MENFFYEDEFFTNLDDLLDYFDIDDGNLKDIEDDWERTCEETTLEPMFVLTEKFILKTIIEQTDTFEERFPENSDHLFEEIKKAIKQGIDINKINSNIPKLYYPNGIKFKVTKKNLVDYCS